MKAIQLYNKAIFIRGLLLRDFKPLNCNYKEFGYFHHNFKFYFLCKDQ